MSRAYPQRPFAETSCRRLRRPSRRKCWIDLLNVLPERLPRKQDAHSFAFKPQSRWTHLLARSAVSMNPRRSSNAILRASVPYLRGGFFPCALDFPARNGDAGCTAVVCVMFSFLCGLFSSGWIYGREFRARHTHSRLVGLAPAASSAGGLIRPNQKLVLTLRFSNPFEGKPVPNGAFVARMRGMADTYATFVRVLTKPCLDWCIGSLDLFQNRTHATLLLTRPRINRRNPSMAQLVRFQPKATSRAIGWISVLADPERHGVVSAVALYTSRCV